MTTNHTGEAESTFCPVPWVSASINNSGHFRACCQCALAPGGSFLEDSNGRVLNCSDTPISETRNHPILKKMRSDMLKGIKTPLCKTCWDEESFGVTSKRVSEKKRMTREFGLDQARQLTSADGHIGEDVPVKSWDIRFSNNCNLACRMCSPSDSSAWYSDYVAMTGQMSFQHQLGAVELTESKPGVWIHTDRSIYKWHEKEFFWDQLALYYENMKSIYMAGGEPLISNQHYELLENLVARGISKKIELDYATNLTVLPEKVFGLWVHFKNVNLGVSIDGVGKINDYIRHPSQWARIEKNFDALETYKGNNLHCYTNSTLSALNTPSCWRLLDWFISRKKSGKKFPQRIFSHLVSYPDYLSPSILPSSVLQICRDKIEEISKADSKLISRHEELQHGVSQLRSALSMIASEDKRHLVSQLIQKTEKLDEIRKQKWEDFLDFELKELVGNAGLEPTTSTL